MLHEEGNQLLTKLSLILSEVGCRCIINIYVSPKLNFPLKNKLKELAINTCFLYLVLVML